MITPVKAKDSTGQTWRVTRRWVPWRRRVRGAGDAWSMVPTLPAGEDPISAVITIVILVVFAPVILLALVLTVLATIEFAVILLLIPVLFVARALFGRHWIVEVRRGYLPYYEEHAGDWSTSHARIESIAGAIERGDRPPHTLGAGAPDPVSSA